MNSCILTIIIFGRMPNQVYPDKRCLTGQIRLQLEALFGPTKQNQERELIDRILVNAPSSNFIDGHLTAALLVWFGSLVIVDVLCFYSLFFLLCINIEIGKIRC